MISAYSPSPLRIFLSTTTAHRSRSSNGRSTYRTLRSVDFPAPTIPRTTTFGEVIFLSSYAVNWSCVTIDDDMVSSPTSSPRSSVGDPMSAVFRTSACRVVVGAPGEVTFNMPRRHRDVEWICGPRIGGSTIASFTSSAARLVVTVPLSGCPRRRRAVFSWRGTGWVG